MKDLFSIKISTRSLCQYLEELRSLLSPHFIIFTEWSFLDNKTIVNILVAVLLLPGEERGGDDTHRPHHELQHCEPEQPGQQQEKLII